MTRDPGTTPAAGMLLIVSAPSGAGKTSLVAALLERDAQLVVSISHTTRPMRPRERDGVDYHFIDGAEFQRMARAGEFLEHAEVFGNRYGTSSAAVDGDRTAGRDVILEIDFQGARQIRQRYPEAQSVFILPPSRAALEERLRKRQQDDPAVIQQRLEKAVWEMSNYAEYDYLVVNDDFDTALCDIESIIRAERLRLPAQRQRLEPLLNDLLSGS
ncbi:MAG: guanylate kinase [Pseudomonadales bacterium]